MSLFANISDGVAYLLIFGLILLMIETGFRLGLTLRKRNIITEKDSSTSVMVSALMGLLAFFLAFSIGFALTNFTTRKQLVVSEANAIGTAYLRTDFLDQETRSQVQELFRKYLALRFEVIENPGVMQDAVRRGEDIQNQIWALSAEYASQNPGETVALYIEAVNDVIDLQTVRVASDQSLRLPSIFWLILYGLLILSFLLVGIASSADGKRNFFALALFALAFAAAMVLLIDLNNPHNGLLEVGQNAMLSLQSQIGTPMP